MDYCPLNNKPCSNPKNLLITNLLNGSSENINICQCCMFQNKSDPFFPPNYVNLINIIDEIVEKKIEKCQNCNLRFSDIIQKARYGCPDCYKTFKEQSINIFKKCQVSNKHLGKIPKDWEKKFLLSNSAIQIALLNEQLGKAVAEEQYEEAALIHKKIKEIQEAKEKHEI